MTTLSAGQTDGVFCLCRFCTTPRERRPSRRPSTRSKRPWLGEKRGITFGRENGEENYGFFISLLCRLLHKMPILNILLPQWELDSFKDDLMVSGRWTKLSTNRHRLPPLPSHFWAALVPSGLSAQLSCTQMLYNLFL